MSPQHLPDTFDSGLRPESYERPVPIETPWGSFALFPIAGGADGAFIAVQSFCPHMEGPLFQGTRTGDEIVCPWHRWRFALRTGELLEAESDRPDEPPGPEFDLAVCAVSVGPAGTLVLERPRPRNAQHP